MNSTVDQNEVEVIQLTEILDISHAEEFKQTLGQALELNKDIQLDCSAVQKIDTSVLQLLAAFLSQCSISSTQVTWHDPENVIFVAAELTGLDEILEITQCVEGKS